MSIPSTTVQPGTEKAFNPGTVQAVGTAAPISGTLRQQLKNALGVFSLLLIDIAAVVVAFSMAYVVRMMLLPYVSTAFLPEPPANMLSHIWWLPLVLAGCIAFEGLYTKRYSFWRECGHMVRAATLTYIIALAIITLAKAGNEVSRTMLVISWFLTLLILPSFRYIGKNFLIRTGLLRRRVLVLGAGKTGELVVRALNRESYLGYQIISILDDDPKKKNKVFYINGGPEAHISGDFKDAEEIISQTGVRHAIVAAPGLPAKTLVDLANRLKRLCESVTVIPDLFGLPVMGAEADYYFDERFLALRLRNNLASRSNIFLKRVFDLVVGSTILLLTLPAMFIIALLIKLDSAGPVIFGHQRVGKKGRVFICYKFRTMVTNAQDVLDNLIKNDKHLRSEWENDFKLQNDPRVTRLGGFLRKTSLDELPQIINVLKGEMSLVGPRPIVDEEIEKYNHGIDYYYQVLPGITGLWQVSGRSEVEYSERVQIDTWYVRNWSLWLDITLLIRTIPVVLGKRGAY